MPRTKVVKVKSEHIDLETKTEDQTDSKTQPDVKDEPSEV